jgi:hypothetical protein
MDSNITQSLASPDNLSIIQKKNAWYTNSITQNQVYWAEADLDMRFWAGDQDVFSQLYGFGPGVLVKKFFLNHIRPQINVLSGREREHRKSPICVPVENSAQQTADQLTKLIFHINHSSFADQALSDAFEVGACITGMSLLAPYIDYSDDPINGDIQVRHIPYNSFLIDPYFTKTDLSDCNFVWMRQWISKEKAIQLFPDQEERVMGMKPSGQTDGKFQYMAQSYNFGAQNLFYMDEIYYRGFREAEVLIDFETGEMLEFEDRRKAEMLEAESETVAIIKKEIPTVKMAQFLQNKLFYDGNNPLNIDEMPFVPVIGYYAPQLPYMNLRIQGVVRGLRDAQYLYTRRKMIELDTLESQVNSGWVYKAGSVLDIRDLYQGGQGKGIALKDDAEMTDIQKIQPPVLPPTTLETSRILEEEINKISGITPELMGAASDDIAGVLSMLRQGAGLIGLRGLFDRLENSQRILNELFIRIAQQNWSPQKVARIIGEMPTEEFFTKAFGKYNVRIEEGILTTTQRQMEFAQLIQLRELGVPIDDEALLQSATVQNKDKLIESIQQKQQQQSQQMQQQEEAQLALLQAQISNLEAQATANEGLGVERVSRVQENRALAVERIAEARKDQSMGTLDLAKAIKELEGMDIANVMQLLQVAQVIKDVSLQPSAELSKIEADAGTSGITA